MKELILNNPLILIFILLIGLIYTFVAFHYTGTDKTLAANLEKICLGIFLISIAGATGATINPFDKLHPLVLSLQGTTLPTIAGQLGIYSLCLFLLFSRLRYTLKDFIHVLAVLLRTAPFFCAFILLFSLSFSWSNSATVTLKTTFVYLETTLIAIYLGKQYSWREIFSFWRWVNIIIVIICIYYGFFVPSVGVGPLGWQGILGHKNQFSFIMAQTAVLWLMHAFYSPKQRYLSLVFVLLSLFALQEGGSGASKVLVVALLSLWVYFGFVKKLKVQWAFVSVILFMILSVCLTILVTENLEFIVVDTLNKDMTITGRTDFWPIIINKINQQPILGYGLAGFWQPWRGADNPGGDIIVAASQFRPGHSHNGFLDVAVDLGWLGLSLYACSFLNNIAKSVVYLSRNRLPEAGLPLLLSTYILLTNFTETGLLGVTSIWFFYVVMTTRLSLDTIEKTSKPKREAAPAQYNWTSTQNY
ncbi:MAG: O-antigen ligase family protein [Kastovskya adunca ATA6-11-RM4]|jgi:O-antigen ligase|nr:O-antigen ligase family protein [Kastovskya adunca ATA6-11-RM4]